MGWREDMIARQDERRADETTWLLMSAIQAYAEAKASALVDYWLHTRRTTPAQTVEEIRTEGDVLLDRSGDLGAAITGLETVLAEYVAYGHHPVESLRKYAQTDRVLTTARSCAFMLRVADALRVRLDGGDNCIPGSDNLPARAG